MRFLDCCESITGWTVLNDETETIAASTMRLTGTYSLSFAKVTGDTTVAGVYKTIVPNNFDLEKLGGWRPWDYLTWEVYASALTDIVSTFVRLGSDHGTNYVEYRRLVASHTAGAFNLAYARLGDGLPPLAQP